MCRKYLISIAALAALSFSGAAFAQNAWHVGDKVSVWVSADYYDGTVLEVGSGDHAGQYLIHFDKFTSDQYALAKNVVARKPAAAEKTGPNGCRIILINGLPACDPATVKRR